MRLYFISLEILVTKAIFDQPIGNEYYGGRKKRFRHGLNRVIQNKDDNDETTILYTNDEGHESTGQKRKKQYFLTNNANDPQLQLPDRFSVLNFQTHHDKDEWTSQFDNEEALEENKSKLAFWGRLYLDGFPFPMQYFRAHFGLPPPKGYFDFILIHTNEICIKGNETQHREIYANTVIVSERGTCSFSDKALTAFGLGAKAILFINNEVGNIHPSGPRAHDANISVSMISKSDGNLVYDAFQKSNKLRGYFIPILCDRNEKEGMLCEPFRKLDINLVQNITYDGDIFLVDDTIDRDRGQRFKYLQGTFGGQVINKVWSLVDAPIYDPYACKDIKDNNTTKKLNGFAVLVKRGKCDFGQKAQGERYLSLFPSKNFAFQLMFGMHFCSFQSSR